LACLPESHVVGEDGAAPAEEEGDAFDLMGEESRGESFSTSKGFGADFRGGDGESGAAGHLGGVGR
jgi:hypothetical protein